MKITSTPLDKAVSDGPIDAFSHALLGDSPSLDEMLEYLASLQTADPRYRYLFTLDDVGQCRYTSMHASDDARIALYEDEDPETPEDALAARERLLAHVVAQLEHSSHRLEWSALPGTLMCSDEDIEALGAANATPDLIVDEVVCVQQVPVDRDDLLIAALPNGYFSADWDIFQNHALIRHLQEHHDYRLFGLGASWLGFQRDSAPSPAQANALVADLQRVYAAGTHDTWSKLAATLATRTTLLLGYTEDFSEQLP
ncbi:TPA: hypothetical protein ACGW13_004173 [Stenotrophomonas maltophilia]|uniref:hypothetical protein n=1 Tax=Stenotrophomonas TaxID=40323 RepID=UPI00066C34C8|nr:MULTISPECIES: hypothetical protein [Stenotrophomonas]HBZ8062334.1 hypothetical protein [Klebsiella pneumoniae]EKT4100715.1 hypothetical protein [Stenotrophomonas maltophilia]MBA0261198.1 hypothetical protein [Stenotrophomonas maltophilia]MBA0314688.1 hypothetical protein [Stenotrophomonas maltophilia]MBB1134516.1 hypothetical protein [Stenotrophomonas sp. I18B00994]